MAEGVEMSNPGIIRRATKMGNDGGRTWKTGKVGGALLPTP